MRIKVTHANAEDHVVEVVEELLKLFTYSEDRKNLYTGFYGDTLVTGSVEEILSKAGFELEVG